jgi:hypothetical protein
LIEQRRAYRKAEGGEKENGTDQIGVYSPGGLHDDPEDRLIDDFNLYK